MLPICPVEIHTQKPKPKGYPNELITLGEHITAKRLDLKLSKSVLAKELDINVMTLHGWENGSKIPVPKMMKKIISFLGYVPPLGVNENTLGGQLHIYRMKYGYTLKDISLMLGIDSFAPIKIEQNKEVLPMYGNKVRELIEASHQGF